MLKTKQVLTQGCAVYLVIFSCLFIERKPLNCSSDVILDVTIQPLAGIKKSVQNINFYLISWFLGM